DRSNMPDALEKKSDNLTRVRRAALHVFPGNRFRGINPLAGGVGSRTFMVDLENEDETRMVVARVHRPEVISREAMVMEAVGTNGVSVPEVFGHANGVLFTSHVHGSPSMETAPTNAQMKATVAELVTIHRTPPPSKLPSAEQRIVAKLARVPTVFDEAVYEREVRGALALHWPPKQSNSPVLLHGDYWPGNLLWEGDRLSAVIDWEDTGVGDPLFDMANTYRELLWIYGENAAEGFIKAYTTQHPEVTLAVLPIWHLAMALRVAGVMDSWGLSTEERDRFEQRTRRIVEIALAQLADEG
ncbi:MAG: aminoglycoside phosphotransferase family protein, partial [Chloroflexota bacterium]